MCNRVYLVTSKRSRWLRVGYFKTSYTSPLTLYILAAYPANSGTSLGPRLRFSILLLFFAVISDSSKVKHGNILPQDGAPLAPL